LLLGQLFIFICFFLLNNVVDLLLILSLCRGRVYVDIFSIVRTILVYYPELNKQR
jgi:hypothetical protein